MVDLIDDKLKNRIDKIRALAERGVGGEKATAQAKLDKLLSDNGLTLDDLTDEDTHYYLFSYTDRFTRKLLCQVIYKILGADSGSKFYRTQGKRMKIGVYCSASQKIEIDLEYEFYRDLFFDEVDDMLSAFIQKQDLFPSDGSAQTVDINSLTPEEKARILKQQAYQQNMTKQTRKMMIEQHS